MKRRARATLALPLAILLSGAVIPLVVRGGGRAPAPPIDAAEPRYAGRTARQWCAMATASLERQKYDLAIRYFKTAERAESGLQYENELARARRERRRAAVVAGSRARLLEGELDGLELDSAGAVVAAYRATVALPGESLWTLAEALVAAERGVPASDVDSRDAAVYGAWDALTTLNGVRELDVGEIVLVPVPEQEAVAISAGNALDLETIELAGARVERLLADARGMLATADEMSRPSGHGELVAVLREAARLLSEAQAAAGVSAAPEAERVAAMLSEALQYRVGSDGLIAATKPAGVAYTDFALATVEWFLKRELERSCREYPDHDKKTADDIAWAAYLMEASALAEREGVDFAGLLTAAGNERQIRLPNPAEYFAERGE